MVLEIEALKDKYTIIVLEEKVQSEAGQLLRNCLIFAQNLRVKAKQPSCP